ncbi:hypothetical protein CERSUDRAFT_94679 [Gelatoporia subvermispora B]|uniref:Carboxylesterase type B domain-containing protein n=1 Tax=Ceriporiopsis subvermispora (strain B) TaxID=914234 RepID=M2RGS8_CERS8|nr:hypothetical protein CERSUDRAFT_94679 [Gelatoporia subvermispora B]
MLVTTTLVIFTLSYITLSQSVSVRSSAAPVVVLDNGVFIGNHVNGIDEFLGVPYAQAPVGNLRFRCPQGIEPYHGTYNSTAYGNVCPQDYLTVVGSPANVTFLEPFLAAAAKVAQSPNVTQSEDCLNLDVYVPAGAKPGANIPVIVWLPISAFLFGGSSFLDGKKIVERSLQNHEPVILVSINYRMNAFGFLPGQEAKDAGVTNLGLRDQRQAFRWVQQYIRQFGGDPKRVTMWGGNAGGTSAGIQMLTNGGNAEGLFTNVWMHGGFPLPLNTYLDLQGTYDGLVNGTSCQGSSDSLDCLRQLPFEELYNAMTVSRADERFGRWQVTLDYDFIAEQPETLLTRGSVSRVPLVVGDTEDEGTSGALNLTSITTDNDTATWLMEEGIPGISAEDVEHIFALYPSDPAAGSPFGTGDMYAFTPQYKRLSAIIGDLEYHAQRRFFLNYTSGYLDQPTWSFLSKEFKYPYIGATDLSEMLNIWGPGSLTDRLISFATYNTPNNNSGVQWREWTIPEPHQLNVQNDSSFTEGMDTFRAEGTSLLRALNIQHPE